MEIGYYDACIPMCLNKPVENRQWYACQKVSNELPKPTMARWCEHGYLEGYRGALQKLQGVFQADSSESNSGDL